MKKFYLIIIVFLLSGCYDYKGLNDLAIVSGIAIDYVDDNFLVTFEVMKTKKEGDSSGASGTYYVSQKGKNLVDCFTLSANKLDKVPYFEHVEIVIFSKTVALEKLDLCIDYLIRTERLRNEFYAAIGIDSAKDLLKTKIDTSPVTSSYLTSLLINNYETSNSAYLEVFTKTVKRILTDGEDALLPVFKKNDEEIVLVGMGAFKDYKLQMIFDNKEASIINLINNFEVKNIHFTNNNITIAVYNSKIDIYPEKNEIIIKGDIEARISEVNSNIDLYDTATYSLLEDDFKKVIEKEISKIIVKMQQIKSNALSLGKKYYNKYRIKSDDWINKDIVVNIDLKINKKGLTFEVPR